MDQNVSKQKNPAKPTNSPAQKSTTSLVFTPSFYTKGVNNSHIFPFFSHLDLRLHVGSCPWWQVCQGGKGLLEPRKPSCLIMLVVKGRWQIFTSRNIRVWDWFCVVEVVCEKHPSKKLIHLFGAQKKKWLDHPKFCEVWLLTTRRNYPAPRCCVSRSLRHEKGEQLHIPFPPLHKFIEITGL